MQPVQRRLRFGEVSAARTCTPHGVRGFLQLARCLLESVQRLLARQALELPGQFLCFVGQLPLALPSTANLIVLQVGRTATHALVFLLLPTGQLLQPLERRVDLLIDLLLLPALHALVLVLHLVQFQLEQVREVFDIRVPTAPAPTALPLTHLHIPESRLRTLQMLQCPLRRG